MERGYALGEGVGEGHTGRAACEGLKKKGGGMLGGKGGGGRGVCLISFGKKIW